MRKISKSRVGVGITGSILLFVLVLGPERRKAAVWKIKALTRSQIYYPTSQVFLAANGQPLTQEVAEQLERQVLPISSKVLIDLGDMPTDTTRNEPFKNLSPVIRKYPKASHFKMTWAIRVPNYSADFELIYNRDKGEVTEIRTDHHTPGRAETRLLGKYLTDRDIHEAGLDALMNGTNFELWASRWVR